MHKSLSIGYWIGSIERVLQIIDIFETKKINIFWVANYWSEIDFSIEIFWVQIIDLSIEIFWENYWYFWGPFFHQIFLKKLYIHAEVLAQIVFQKAKKHLYLQDLPWKRLVLGKGLSLEKLWGSALEKAAWLEGEEPEIIQNPMWILAFSTKLLLPMRTWWQTWAPMSTCPGQMHHAQLGWSGAFLCGGHS